MIDAMAAVKSVLGVPPAWPHVPESPDCKAGKHRACGGGAWDFANDKEAPCPCVCHVKDDAA